jgi:hypothetical protein
MGLFYVTGLSGTGKSAVLSELRGRGYHARGVDEDSYADWINRAAGTPDDFPRDAPDLDSPMRQRSAGTPAMKRHTANSTRSSSTRHGHWAKSWTRYSQSQAKPPHNQDEKVH